MIAIFAETSVQILGKQVTDPKLQLFSFVAFILFFAGTVGLAMTTRMVDEERIRAEPSISKLFRRGLASKRILTDAGQKIKVTAIIAIIAGIITLITIALVAQ